MYLFDHKYYHTRLPKVYNYLILTIKKIKGTNKIYLPFFALKYLITFNRNEPF